MSCDWSCDRSLDRRQKKNIHVKDFLLRSGDETRHDETNERNEMEVSWEAESPCRHLCRHAIQSLCVCHMNCLYTYSLLLNKAGMASRNIVVKKQYTFLWISFAVVFGLLVFGSGTSPQFWRGGGPLYTGNFNPISSSFIQKCSLKYSLCLLRKGIKLRELTKRNFALRRGILQVKRSLKLSSARSLSAASLGPGKQEKGLKTGADRLQKRSLLSGRSNRVLSRFSGERRQARSQRGAPPSRVSGACHSRVASHADVLMGPSRVPVGQESVTNPQERLRGRLLRAWLLTIVALPAREFVERVSTVSPGVTCVLIFDIVQRNMLLLVWRCMLQSFTLDQREIFFVQSCKKY